MMKKLATSRRFDFLPTPRDRVWDFVVLGAGCRFVPPHARYQVQEKDSPFQWHRGRTLPDYGLVYLTHGGGSFRTADTRPACVQVGDVLLLRPGVWHNYRPNSQTGWHEYWVLFNGPAPSMILQQLFQPLSTSVLHPGLDDTLHHLFEQLLAVAQTNPPYCNPILAALTSQILATILSRIQTQQEPIHRDQSAVHQARIFLEDRWNQTVDMQALAKSLGLSYRHFRRVFKNSTGLPPQQYLLNLRINRAKTLLEEHRLSIGQIAQQCGFADPYYFSRTFKLKTGSWPSQWQQ